MNRTALNATEKSQIASSYNSKGQLVDPDTRQPLQSGKIDIGHRYGYEHSALSRCAERCHMTQKEFNAMIKQNANRIFHWQDRTENRNHDHECKDYKIQNRKCIQLIREFKNKIDGTNRQSARTKNSKSTAEPRSKRGMKVVGYERLEIKASGEKISGRSGGIKGTSGGLVSGKESYGAKGSSPSGGKGSSSGVGGKGSSGFGSKAR